MEKSSLFKIYNNLEEYKEAFNQIDQNEIREIPIFIERKRNDLYRNIERFDRQNFKLTSFFKCDAGVLLSKELEFYKNSNIFCKRWFDKVDKGTKLKSILLIGLYKDFSQNKVLKLLEYCKKEKIKVFLLTGRDLSSLSWLIGKQFITRCNNDLKKAVFSHKKMNEFNGRNLTWEIFDIKRLKNENIKKILTEEKWSELVFHGHGKEDHLNLADFTLHGFNKLLSKNEEFAPSWGHEGQSFFKDEKKAVRISSLNVEKIFLLSCSNFPFNDSRLYDTRFNLTLDAIDGMARNIVASTCVQSVDNPELHEIFLNSNFDDIGVRLHNKLDDVQPFVSIVCIGLPQGTEINNTDEKYNQTERLTKDSRIILSRLSSFTSSGLLNKNHSISKLSQNVLLDYMQMTRRGTYGVTKEKYLDFERDLINRVNPISKQMAEIMIHNQNDELFEFDRYNIFRSIVDKNSVSFKKCTCGSSGVECNYFPETENLFKIHSFYCYKCGDKYTSMLGMPKIDFTCDDYDKEKLKIKYKIVITPQMKGDVFLGVQLPTYVEKSSDLPIEVTRIRFKNITPKVVEGEVNFKEDTLLQSYYLKLFIVQNGGIAISRCFFNLINTSKDK